MSIRRAGAKVLDDVARFYVESGDFNGLPVDSGRWTTARLTAAKLVETGLVQVVSGKDNLIMHIRPWPSRRTVEEQLACLDGGHQGVEHVCLYPTPAAMASRLGPTSWADEPYRRALALGKGQLETAAFTLDALEHYRNDPRYRFQCGDFEVSFGISDDADADERQPTRDKITLVRAGFAYDPSSLADVDKEALEAREASAPAAIRFAACSKPSAEEPA